MDITKPNRVVFPTFNVGPNPEIPLTHVRERYFDLLDRDPSPCGEIMLDRHDDRTITAQVDEVLAALRENLAEHKEIVAEAQEGYAEKCREALTNARKRINRRLAALKDGKEVEMKPINFNLTPPQDHSREFNIIIKMLELHKSAHEGDHGNSEIPATIDLKAADVQRFVLNDWSWQEQFLATNSVYSGKAAMLYASK